MPGMMSIGGAVSGLQTHDIIAKIMEYARRPVEQYEVKKAKTQQQLATWQTLNTRMLALKVKTDSLYSPKSFQGKLVTSTDTDLVTASGTPEAAPGVYDIKIASRAQAHQLGSTETYSSVTDVIGTGTISITVGSGDPFEITLDENNNTVAALRDAINRENKGVRASIVNVGNSDTPQYKLLLSSTSTGTANAISNVTVNLTGGTAPTFDTGNPVQAAQDAEVVVGNGTGQYTVTRSSNTITDVIPGVTLNILNADNTKTVQIEVKQNKESIKSAIQDFVNQYNDLMGAIDDQFDYDNETGESGILMGSYQLQTVQMDLEAIVNNTVAGADSSFSALSSVGITLGSDGRLNIDSTELDKALNDNPAAVEKLFGYGFDSDSSYVSFISSSTDTKASGVDGWDVEITQVATRAEIRAGAAMNGTLGADEKLTINGHDIQLTAGSSLTEVINEINKNSDETGVTAYETIDGTDHYLTIRRIQYGSDHEISVLSSRSNASGDTTGLGNVLVTQSDAAGESGTGIGSEGQDVAGTIGGEAATGKGQILTGAPEDESFGTKGLVLQINYSELPTSPINVTYTKGVTASLRDAILNMTSSTGIVTSAQDTLNNEIDAITEDIANMEERLQARELQLYEKFNRMEVQMANLQQQGNYLASALGSSSQQQK